MEILITNHQMHLFAGSETFSYTLARALQAKGHDVTIFTAEKGAFGQIAEKLGIPVIQDPDLLRERRFDVIHAHHNALAMVARGLLPETPMLFVSHGPLAELEQPPSIDCGIAVHVAVSEEVRDHLAHVYGVESEIIRNGIDCARFRPLTPIGGPLKNILVISNHFPEPDWRLLSRICAGRGISVRQIGLQSRFEWNTEEAINGADAVVSLGRGALEAMACGRAVLLWDHFGSDGWITKESYPLVRTCNFSGRVRRYTYDESSLAGELDAYSVSMGETNRSIACAEHDIDACADRFLTLYRRAIDIGVSGTYTMPVRELLHYFQVWRDRQAAVNASIELNAENQRLRAEISALQPKLQALMERLAAERQQLEQERRRLRPD